MSKKAFLTALCILGWLTAPALPAHAGDEPILGAPGGDDYTATCPGGFLTGVHARAGSFVDSLQGHCDGGNTVSFGGAGGNDLDSDCPSGEVVTGLVVTWGLWVDSLMLVCKPRTGGGNAHALSPIGGNGGISSVLWQCPNGTAAVTMRGGAGQFVNRIGLVCANL